MGANNSRAEIHSQEDRAENHSQEHHNERINPDEQFNPYQKIIRSSVNPLKFAEILKYVKSVDLVDNKDNVQDISDLEFAFDKLGEGSFGAVGNVFVTAKLKTKCQLQGVTKDIKYRSYYDLNYITREIKILDFIKQNKGTEFCLKFIGWWDGNSQWCKKPNHIFILTEKCHKELFYAYRNEDNFDTKEVFLQICKGLNFLHTNNIVHLDIKPENIMFTDDTFKKIKIIDFGMARFIKKEGEEIKPTQGTPGFVSPEMIFGEIITTKADMFAVGAMLYNIVTIFEDFGDSANINDINNVKCLKNLKNIDKIVQDLTEELQYKETEKLQYKEIMRACLKKDPKERASAQDVINMIADQPVSVDEQSVSVKDPKERASAQDVINMIADQPVSVDEKSVSVKLISNGYRLRF